MRLLILVLFLAAGGVLSIVIDAKRHGWEWFSECNTVHRHQRRYPINFPIFDKTFTPLAKAWYIISGILAYIILFLMSWIGVIIAAVNGR